LCFVLAGFGPADRWKPWLMAAFADERNGRSAKSGRIYGARALLWRSDAGMPRMHRRSMIEQRDHVPGVAADFVFLPGECGGEAAIAPRGKQEELLGGDHRVHQMHRAFGLPLAQPGGQF